MDDDECPCPIRLGASVDEKRLLNLPQLHSIFEAHGGRWLLRPASSQLRPLRPTRHNAAQAISPQIQRFTLLAFVGILDIYAQRHPGLGGRGMVGDMANDDGRDAKLS